MNITQAAIEKNRVTAAALLVVAVMGINSFLGLPQSEDPGFLIRVAVVQTIFPGASPERVEQLVTDKLEKVIQEIPELDFVASQSKTGVSIINVNIREEYTDLRPIWDNLRRKIDDARGDLPDDVRGPFVNDEFGDVFGIVVTITGDGFDYAEIKEIADEVRDELLLLEDVAKVEIFGAQEERIFVEYNNARLAEYGHSPIQLQQLLEAQNIIIPGGSITTEYEKIVLEPSGNFESLEGILRTVIQLPASPRRGAGATSSDLVYLQDLAEIRRGYIDPPESMARGSGGSCLALAISMREGGNIVELGEVVRPALERLEAFYPIGVDFDWVQFAPDTVTELVDGFVVNLYQAIAIVTLVMLFSLGLRTGLVVASLIPMAMLSTLLMMSVFSIGLDQMSIASMIIALGMLVDNAIVMSESIMVSMSEGKKPVQAAVESAAELRIPLLTSSLTTAAAFLPIFLAESAVGEYTAPLFKVVTITLLCSWVLSLTMIPMLCAVFLRVTPSTGDAYDSRFYRLYRGLLTAGLKRRALSLLSVAAAFFLAIMGLGLVPNIFFPPNDRPTFTTEVELPVGTPIERTETVVAEIEDFIREELVVGAWGRKEPIGWWGRLTGKEASEDGIVNWGTFIGNGGPKFTLGYNPGLQSPEYGILLVNTVSRPAVDEIIPHIEAFANGRYPDAKTTVRPLANGPPAWPPVEVRLSGRDTDVLFDLVDQVKAKMREIPGTKLIDDDWGARSKKLVVQVDGPRARRAGVSNQDVAISLQTFLEGLETTEFREGDQLIPVTLRSVAAERQDIDKIETLNIYSQSTGSSVPLKQVADVEIAWEPAQVKRRNRLRTVAVECGVEPGTTAAAVDAVLLPWLEEQAASWPPGYSFEIGGENESSNEANASIGAKLPIAGLIIVLLLVTQFNSLRRPLIILIAIPLGVIGVVIGLLVARSYFGFMTLLGIISLAGIVINNAIVLLDRIRIEIDDNGLEPQRAILESAQKRLRPILLTTCTTIGGMLPLWFGGGAMWEPMSIAIIFGLAFATMLTLGVVPILYSLFFRVSFRDFRYD
ncbi:MAG: efflux RND transporter permease subunit [bacterium]|nr:efflux RND transporter permease subunit [bacterium]